LLRPILDNIDLSEEQYQWVNRHYMEIQMQIELAEDIDCNEKSEKPVKPAPEQAEEVEATEEDADMHELKPIDEQ
jgi:hypothetical protein